MILNNINNDVEIMTQKGIEKESIAIEIRLDRRVIDVLN